MSIAILRHSASFEFGQPRTASWYVRYLLQAAGDPGLLTPAEEARKAKSGAGKKGSGKGKGKHKARPAQDEEKTIPPSEPLPADISLFWNGGNLPKDFFGEVQIPPLSATLLRKLGKFPFWREKERFFDALEPIYARASMRGLAVFLGEMNRS